MQNNHEKQIFDIIKFSLPIFILFSFLSIVLTFYVQEKSFLEKEKKYLQQEYKINNDLLIKQNIDNVFNIIEAEQKATEKNLIKELNEFLKTAHVIATNLYEKNKNKFTEEQIKKLIIDALRDIRFNNERVYFFIYDKKGTNIMLPPNPYYEGLNFIEHRDVKGKYIIKEMIESLKNQDTVSIDWYWFKPGFMNEQRKKIGVVKNFAPFDWFIGTGEYVEDFEKTVQEKLLNEFSKMKFGKSGYIFVLDYEKNYLTHVKKEYIGKNAVELNDTKDVENVMSNLISIGKKGGGYYSYIQNEKPGSLLSVEKTAYVKSFPKWNWIIGTGYYEDDFNNELVKKEDILHKNLKENLFNTLLLISLISLFFIFILLSFSKKLHKLFKRHKVEISNYILKTNKQHEILAQQSKMAAMGEMIGNIAHQWRQPLSAITSSASIVKVKKDLKILKEEECIETLDLIIESANYLSNTINDFRYYFTPNKNKKDFNSVELINKLEKFTKSISTANQINIVKHNIQDFKLNTYENELVQVLLNIINNSKDEFNKKQTPNKYIFIDFIKVENKAEITIKDSAGGINEKIISRIFEPYFTTKHKSKGTGIGLYMSLEIVKKHLNGHIEVQNEEFEFEDKKLKGAAIKITFPLS